MAKIYKTQLIELILPSGNSATKYPFPEQPNLRNAKIIGVEVVSSGIVPKSPISGDNVATETILANTFLTLVDNAGVEFISLMPLPMLKTVDSSADSVKERDFKQFVGQITNWTKSYISLAESRNMVVNASILLNITYVDDTLQNVFTRFDDKK